MTDHILMQPVSNPVCGAIRPPGSKSITNRALILAALADGQTKLSGVLDSVDTQVMLASLKRLGFCVANDTEQHTCLVDGQAGFIPNDTAELFLENSGTSIRFLTALCALGKGRYSLDGIPRMRERPIGDLINALHQWNCNVVGSGEGQQFPPVMIDGSAQPLVGGPLQMKANISSQYLSAVLMAAGAATEPTIIKIDGQLVSKPYITMTLKMMDDFGVNVEHEADLSRFCIPSCGYTARSYDIEPDASAASYFFAAAAITGGQVTVEGLNKNAMQGDILFVEALAQMGCEVEFAENSVTVTGRPLNGIDIDMNEISDTAQTLAAVAVYAKGPTTIRGVEHMRHKETDRVTAVVNELRRCQIQADEFDDGLRIHPGTPQPASIETYDDHRMAMSFALLGLKTSGIRILDPGCTSKTYPRFFEDLSGLCSQAN